LRSSCGRLIPHLYTSIAKAAVDFRTSQQRRIRSEAIKKEMAEPDLKVKAVDALARPRDLPKPGYEEERPPPNAGHCAHTIKEE
jgi:hypothetical protein